MSDKWADLDHVPKRWRVLEGGRLSLDQCNLIYKDIAVKKAKELTDGRMDPDYSKARLIFKGLYKKKAIGNHLIWEKRPTDGGNV